MNTQVKVGQEIYVPTRLYIDHGEDDVMGGLATIERIVTHPTQTFIYVEEHPGNGYSLTYLLGIQDKLREEFGESRAYPDPDPACFHRVFEPSVSPKDARKLAARELEAIARMCDGAADKNVVKQRLLERAKELRKN